MGMENIQNKLLPFTANARKPNRNKGLLIFHNKMSRHRRLLSRFLLYCPLQFSPPALKMAAGFPDRISMHHTGRRKRVNYFLLVWL